MRGQDPKCRAGKILCRKWRIEPTPEAVVRMADCQAGAWLAFRIARADFIKVIREVMGHAIKAIS